MPNAKDDAPMEDRIFGEEPTNIAADISNNETEKEQVHEQPTNIAADILKKEMEK